MAPKRRRLNPTSTATTATATASLDGFLKSALAMADPSISIGLSLERIIDSSTLEADKESLIDGATRVASVLMDVAKRSARKLAATHNASVWPLPAELTTKVFSMLDTKSVCYASATCSLFSKCASDPLCYANIDLTRGVAKVSNQVVSTMIQRAGRNLQSIKLGRLPQEKKALDSSPLTGSCLSALVLDGGTAGLLLRQLHMYNLQMQGYDLCSALSACQSLVELEVVNVGFCLDDILGTICEYCHSIERLSFDTRAISMPSAISFLDGLYLEACELENLIKKCPLLSSLVLRGYRIEDYHLSVLIKEASGLKCLDLLGSFGFSGEFLRDLGNGGCTDSLETLILRDCEDLRPQEVSYFLSAGLYGKLKALRYVDISSSLGLFAGFRRPHSRCAIDVSQTLQERPDIRLIADYPPKLCFYDGCTSSSPSESSSSSSSSDESSSSSSSSDESSSSSSDGEDRY